MSDNFQSVTAGQRVHIPAATWNAMLDAARSHSRSQFDTGVEPEGTRRIPSIAKVRNATGVPLMRFAVIGLGEPLIGPAANLMEFHKRTAVEGLVPAESMRFGILLEPLPVGRIGLAAVAGVVPVRLLVDSVPYDAATPVTGQTEFLHNVPHGPAQVIWMESTGMHRWALVRIDETNFEEMVYITSNTPDADGFYPGFVQRYDTATRQWNSQFACKVLDANR